MKSSVHTASSTGPYADGTWVRRVRGADELKLERSDQARGVEVDEAVEAVEAVEPECSEQDRRDEVVEAVEAVEADRGVEVDEADEAVEAECSEQDRREEGRVRFACLIMPKSNPVRFFLWVALLFDF